MKTNVEVLESGATKLTVTIEAAEVDGRIKKTYKDLGKQNKFPGFRPGHVPRPVIDSRFGKDAVLGQVTEELINELFPLAIDECDLNPISQAKFDDVEGFVEDGKDFIFSAEFEVKPELELSDYSPVHVEIPFKTASEAEIDEQVAALADYYHEYKNAPANTKVKADSAIDITMSAKGDDGEEISVLSAEERIYELGHGLFPAKLDEELVGMKKGESKTVTLNVAENPCMMTSMLKDKTENITFEVTVDVVKKKVVPEVTDEWAKDKLGVESVEELRKQVAARIEQEKGAVIPQILENNALYELQQRVEGEVPASMVEEAEAELLQNFFGQLQRQGLSFDVYLQQQGITPDKFKEDVKLQAADTVKQNLALDAWARKADITVSDEEVADEFKNSGAKDYEKMFADWKAQGRLHIVREGILRGKALEAVLRDAEVEEVEKLSSAKEEKPAKKTSKKKAAKKDEAPAEAEEASSEE